eukprot:3861953-Ditylum_brightwellii.AAC.1
MIGYGVMNRIISSSQIISAASLKFASRFAIFLESAEKTLKTTTNHTIRIKDGLVHNQLCTPKWVVGRDWAYFVKSHKSKLLGLNPGQGWLKVEPVAVHP